MPAPWEAGSLRAVRSLDQHQRQEEFGGREFRFGSGEIGHIHPSGVVDIPFPRSVRNALLTGAEERDPDHDSIHDRSSTQKFGPRSASSFLSCSR